MFDVCQCLYIPYFQAIIMKSSFQQKKKKGKQFNNSSLELELKNYTINFFCIYLFYFVARYFRNVFKYIIISFCSIHAFWAFIFVHEHIPNKIILQTEKW